MPSARVLVVDDSSTARAFAVRALEAVGHQVQAAADIWIAPLVSQFRPSVILMDVEVGQQKGHIAVRALKKRAFAEGIAIALHSSLPTDELARLADECGADGFVAKSGNPEDLCAAVEALLASRGGSSVAAVR